MTRPSRFEIMRRNRALLGYARDKARLVEEVDCAELEVLRTLRRNQAEEEYDISGRIERLEQKLGVPPEPTTAPVPCNPQPIRVQPQERGPGLLRTLWNWTMGMGARA